MNTIWNNTIEGRQYWVQVRSGTLNLELVSDPVSELAGAVIVMIYQTMLKMIPRRSPNYKNFSERRIQKRFSLWRERCRKLRFTTLKRETRLFMICTFMN